MADDAHRFPPAPDSYAGPGHGWMEVEAGVGEAGRPIVRMSFPSKGVYVSMVPGNARSLARALIEAADDAEGMKHG